MIKKLISIFFLAVTVLTGCIGDEELIGIEEQTGATFTIGTRAVGDPNDPDNKITKLRIIAFRSGEVRSNKVYDASLGQTITHTIPVGTYDFVFIANEPSGLTTSLNNLTARTGLNLLSIAAADISRTAFIPQMQEVTGVQVLADNKVQHASINSGAPATNWPLALVRLAARIDVTLFSKEADLTGAFQGVKLTGIPDRVPLVASGYTGTAITRSGTQEIKMDTNLDCFADPSTEEMEKLVDDYGLSSTPLWAKKVVRLIVPFNEFTPATTAANAISMTISLHDRYNPSTTMGVDDQGATKNYTLPRNNYLNCAGEVTTPLLLNITAKDWSEIAANADPTKNRMLNVSEIATPRVLNNYQGEWKISFYSNQPNVQIEPAGKWGEGVTGYTAGTPFNVADYWNITDFAYNAATGMGTVTFKMKDILTAPLGLVTQKVILRTGNDAVTGGEDLRRELTLSMRYLTYAPPGVVGISKSGKLTLKGSSTYKGTVVEQMATNDFGGLEPEPVYITFYKWGSTMAILGGDGDTFDSQDIVWAPGGYKGTPTTANSYDLAQPALDKIRAEVNVAADATTQMGLIPYGDDGVAATVPMWPATEAATGLGDPCAYANTGTTARWHTPSGGPWRNPWRNGEDQYPFGMAEASNPVIQKWTNATVHAAWVTNIPSGTTNQGALTNDGSIFLPFTGERTSAGVHREPRSNTAAVHYWSTTPYQLAVSNYVDGLSLWVGPNGAHAATPTTIGGYTYPIRCVRDNGLVHAAPGMIGIRDMAPADNRENPDAAHELTLAGSDIYANRPEPFVTASPFGALATEPVYAVYYKWGSTVGMIGEVAGINGETGAFDADDVVSKGTFTGTITSFESFTAAPWTGTLGTGNNVDATNAAAGHGDPCRQFTGGWLTPTGNPWKGMSGSTPFGTVDYPYPSSNPYYIPDIPIGHGYAGGIISNDNTMFLPMAVFRSGNGGTAINPTSKIARYWTSTFYPQGLLNDPPTRVGYSIAFRPEEMVVRALDNGITSSFAIRCVK